MTTTSDAAGDAAGDASHANADAALVLLDGGRPFLCMGCICDGLDHFCQYIGGGTNMPLAPMDGGSDFGDASVCPPTDPMCLTFPSQCQFEPSCDCLVANAPFPSLCTCDWDPSARGLAVNCSVP